MKKFLLFIACLLLTAASFGQTSVQQSQVYVGTLTATVQPTVPEASFFSTHTITWVTTGTAVGTAQLQTCTTALTSSCSNMTGSVSGSLAASGTMTVGNLTQAFGAFTITLSTCTACTVTVTYNAFNNAPLSPVLSVANCGLTTTCTPVGVSNFRFYFGSCTAAAATTCTVTGIAPAFTSATSYFCAATDTTTAANAIFKITYSSSSSFVITDANSSSDVFNYVCWGT